MEERLKQRLVGAAVLVFDRALDEAERQDVEAYLYGKYLTNLPPEFTSPADVMVPETTTSVVTLAATDETDNIAVDAGGDRRFESF